MDSYLKTFDDFDLMLSDTFYAEYGIQAKLRLIKSLIPSYLEEYNGTLNCHYKIY